MGPNTETAALEAVAFRPRFTVLTDSIYFIVQIDTILS